MIKIIKERTPVTLIDYFIEYSYKDDPDSGFRFPATKLGAPDFDRMPPEARVNYEACLTDKRLLEPHWENNLPYNVTYWIFITYK